MHPSNSAVLSEVEAIASAEGVSIFPYHRKRIMSWKIDRLKKVWVTGTLLIDGKPQEVVLKIRPNGSVTPREEFVSSEQAASAINSFLASRHFLAARTLRSNFTVPPEWVIREMIAGEVIGALDFPTTANEGRLLQLLQSIRQLLDAAKDEINNFHFITPNWQEIWINELAERQEAVTYCFGNSGTSTIKAILSNTVNASHSLGLLHGDLAPQNILVTPTEYRVIDWGEAAIGPKAIDWITAWSFAVWLPKLRRNILRTMFQSCQSLPELIETKQWSLLVAARMLVKFAENDFYFSHNHEEPRRLAQQAKAIGEQAWKNFKELEDVIQP